MMPASRAVSIGSPLRVLPPRTCARASADITTLPRARASRAVAALPLTSTIRMRPDSSTCDSLFRFILLTPREEERQALERDRQVHAFQFHAARHFDGAGRKVQDGFHARRDGDVDDGLRRRGG